LHSKVLLEFLFGIKVGLTNKRSEDLLEEKIRGKWEKERNFFRDRNISDAICDLNGFLSHIGVDRMEVSPNWDCKYLFKKIQTLLHLYKSYLDKEKKFIKCL